MSCIISLVSDFCLVRSILFVNCLFLDIVVDILCVVNFKSVDFVSLVNIIPYPRLRYLLRRPFLHPRRYHAQPVVSV